MSEFQTTAELTLEVSNRELRNVRREIEDELSDVSLGIKPSMGSAGGGAGAGGGDMNGRERRRRRREFRWARQRTGDMEDAVALLEDIEDKVGGSGSGAGILGLSDELGGVGGAGALTGAATALTGSAIALGKSAVALTGAAAALSVSELFEIIGSENVTVRVENTPLPVEDTKLGVEDTTLDVNDPSPLSVDDPSPLQVERPSWEVGVEKPDDLDLPGGAGAARDVNFGDQISNITGPPSRGEGGPKRIQAPNREPLDPLETLGKTTLGGATAGSAAGFTIGAGAGGVGAIPGAAIGAVGGAALGFGGGVAALGADAAQRKLAGRKIPGTGGGGGGGNGATSVQVQQQTDITTNVDVSVDSDKIVKETTDAFEKEMRKVERDLQKEIDQLERRIQRATS